MDSARTDGPGLPPLPVPAVGVVGWELLVLPDAEAEADDELACVGDGSCASACRRCADRDWCRPLPRDDEAEDGTEPVGVETIGAMFGAVDTGT